MSTFNEIVTANMPRLVVEFAWMPDGSEGFQWGITGGIPLISLVGHITRVQIELNSEAWIPDCDKVALVIVWDASDRTMRHYLHPDIPAGPLCGMLELIKIQLVGSRMAQHAVAQRTLILGPDGRPM